MVYGEVEAEELSTPIISEKEGEADGCCNTTSNHRLLKVSYLGLIKRNDFSGSLFSLRVSSAKREEIESHKYTYLSSTTTKYNN